MAAGGLDERRSLDLLQDRSRTAGAPLEDFACAVVLELAEQSQGGAPMPADRISVALDPHPPPARRRSTGLIAARVAGPRRATQRTR